MSVAAIILAAGASSRMGQPKQLLDWGGQPLVRAVASVALSARLDSVVVVVGAAGQRVAATLDGLPVRVVLNAAYATGQASSLHAGIAALPAEIEAALVLLGDQPFVGVQIIDALVQAWRESSAQIVAPSFGGQRGNPVLFDQRVFQELREVQGDQGARAIIQANQERVLLLPFAQLRPLEDIDTPEDYQRIQQLEF
ncbi:MAG: nucleotidyltransferase family protein [Roseiflexaceae bacterium]|nr:nucleotidyltransferase family protein [Roseiflexaceae bacterium]